MILSDVSVKRPVLAIVMSLLLIVFGVLSFQNLPVREMPDIEFPIVNVVTGYPGASAIVVENRITRLVEDQISGITGIKSLNSTSRDGRSSVVIEFKTSRNIDSAANDVRERVSRILDALPEEANPPEVFKVNADDRAIMWFTLTSPVMDELQITDYARRNLLDRFSVVDGVARIQIGGEQRYAMRIWLDRQQLAARGLTVGDVEQALRAENTELPGGSIEAGDRDFTVRMVRGYLTVDDFRNLVLREGADGHLTRLGEVARVELAANEDRRTFRRNGLTSVGIGIVKQSTSNTLAVAQAAKAEALRIAETLPESMDISLTYDSSIFVERAIEEVYRTLFIAVGLVVLVIYLFLGNIRAALIPSITVPVSLIATFSLLDAFGFSINMLTLLAMVLAIGLVVDDAIVVLENIYRRIEKGEPALLAAYNGARQVAFAVIATTLVLIGVFVPVIFLEGNIGRLFAELALTLSAAVGFSSFVALTLSPMMCSKLLSRKAKKTWLTTKMESAFKRLREAYGRILHISFASKGAVYVALLGSILVSYGLISKIPTEFTPKEDRGNLFISFRGAEGTSFDLTRKAALQVEEKLTAGMELGLIERILVIVPGFGQGSSFNSGMVFTVLPEWEERTVSTEEVAQWINQQVRDITDVQVFVGQFGSRGFGAPVQFVIGGNEYSDLVRFRDILQVGLANYPGLIGVDFDYRETQPQVRVEIDRNRAADLGVSVQTVGRTLETLLGGRRVTTFVDRGEEYDVVLQAADEDRAELSDISNIYVRSSRSGDLIPLSSLVSVREVADAGSLNRFNKIRALTLSARLAPGYSLGEVIDYLDLLVQEQIPDAVMTDLKGESRELRESSNAVAFTFLMALLVVFLILAAQFESFIHPFIIMLTVPMAIAGGLFGLYAAGMTLNIYSQVGIIILVGLATKNGILIVEFANQLRDLGYDVESAVVEAAKIRLRPIIMTGLSTSIGSMPLVLAIGPGSISRSAIGIVIVTGVIFATFFTLFVIPVFYRMLAGYTGSPGRVAKLLRGQQDDALDRPETPAE